MKKLLLSATLLAALTTLQAQTVLLDENFDGNTVNTELSSNWNGLSISSNEQIDGIDPVGSMDVYEGEFPSLRWTPSGDISSYDSIVVEYKIATYLNGGNISNNGSYYSIEIYNGNYADYNGDMIDFNSDLRGDVFATSIEQESNYLSITNVLKPIFNSTFQLFTDNYSGGANLYSTMYGQFQGWDAYDVSYTYCGVRYENDNEAMNQCTAELPQQLMTFWASTIYVEDIKITGYSDIPTGLTDGDINSDRTLVKIYNQLGQERNADTKGEVLYHLYSDGTVDKSFNVD